MSGPMTVRSDGRQTTFTLGVRRRMGSSHEREPLVGRSWAHCMLVPRLIAVSRRRALRSCMNNGADARKRVAHPVKARGSHPPRPSGPQARGRLHEPRPACIGAVSHSEQSPKKLSGGLKSLPLWLLTSRPCPDIIYPGSHPGRATVRKIKAGVGPTRRPVVPEV